jgi:hypothetical protein
VARGREKRKCLVSVQHPIYSSVSTNIFKLHSSVWVRNQRIYVVTDEYMGPVKVKPGGPYIHWLLTQTDEYNITFVDPETDDCNLNIFVGTVEFKKPDE